VFKGMSREEAYKYAWEVVASFSDALFEVFSGKSLVEKSKKFNKFISELDEESIKVITASILFTVKPEYRALYMGLLKRLMESFTTKR
jgi:hypothetical protein